MNTRGQALQPWGWLAAPALLSVVATVLLSAPVRIFGFGLPEPVFPLVLAFVWPVIRPSLLGPVVLLLVGLFLDLLWGGPLGMWALCLVLVYLAALVARSLILGQDGMVLAGWYVAGLILAFFCAYVITTLDSRAAPSLLAVFLQLAFTAALFPLARYLIERFEDADIRFR
jgi:rod shape-determining protein MreD